MRSQADLFRHKLRIGKCGNRFLVCSSQVNADLFGASTVKKLSVLPVYCKSYFCPACATKRRNALYHKSKKALSKDSWYMLTLTTVNNYNNTRDMLLNITKYWNSFLPSFKRRYPNIKYIRVLEVGKGGMVHLHVLINQFVLLPIVRQLWERVSGAYIVDISSKLKHSACINYVLKYISKQIEHNKLSESFFLLQKRRYSFSYNCNLPKKDPSNYTLYFDSLKNYSDLKKTLFSLIQVSNHSQYTIDLACLSPPDKADLTQFCADVRAFLKK